MRFRDLKFVAATLGMLFLVEPAFPQTQASDLKRLLTKQGFCCWLKDDVTLTERGKMLCGSKSLRVIYYDHEDMHRFSGHGARRLLFLEGNIYLGSYDISAIEGPPFKIENNLILFPPQKEGGDRIECQAGELPKNVLLNGDYPEFGK